MSALKCTRNDKSPGSDSYTAEFFKSSLFFLFFFPFILGLGWGGGGGADLSSVIVRHISYGFRKWEMPVTKRQVIITCIPKEGKDRTLLKIGGLLFHWI